MIKNFEKWLMENTELSNMLYHHSNPNNRQSILQRGLRTEYDQTMDMSQPGVVGGIYLSNKPDYTTRSDVWEIDAHNLPVEEDWTTTTTNPEEKWYVVYQDIPPDRIKLIPKNVQ